MLMNYLFYLWILSCPQCFCIKINTSLYNALFFLKVLSFWWSIEENKYRNATEAFLHYCSLSLKKNSLLTQHISSGFINSKMIFNTLAKECRKLYKIHNYFLLSLIIYFCKYLQIILFIQLYSLWKNIFTLHQLLIPMWVKTHMQFKWKMLIFAEEREKYLNEVALY